MKERPAWKRGYQPSLLEVPPKSGELVVFREIPPGARGVHGSLGGGDDPNNRFVSIPLDVLCVYIGPDMTSWGHKRHWLLVPDLGPVSTKWWASAQRFPVLDDP